jgi:uncharacterized membrane protein HdeD (DUF308 family)
MNTAAPETPETATGSVRETKLWYAVLARGGVSLLFAMIAIASPRLSLRGLATLFALYSFVDGALALFCADRVRRTHVVARGEMLTIHGIIGAITGILALLFPHAAALRLIGGLRAVTVGASEIGWGRRGNTSDLIELAGITSVAIGLVLLAWPGPGTIAVAWLLGLIALVSGALTFAGALSHFKSGEGTLSHA